MFRKFSKYIFNFQAIELHANVCSFVKYTKCMIIYLTIGTGISPSTTATGASSALNALSNPMVATGGGGIMNPFDEMLKAASPAIFAFLANLPAVEGN